MIKRLGGPGDLTMAEIDLWRRPGRGRGGNCSLHSSRSNRAGVLTDITEIETRLNQAVAARETLVAARSRSPPLRARGPS